MPDKEESHVDYFSSPAHELAVKHHIEIERQRLHDLIEEEGPLAGVSLCVAILAAYPSFMNTLGLKKVAMKLLEDTLKEAKKE